MSYNVAVIGTGVPDKPDRYAMAYRHAQGYNRLDECRLVACADIERENAQAFAETFGIDQTHIFEDYEEMLVETAPAIVSVCTPPGVHAEIVEECATHSLIEAIHCEKPMAATWEDCRRMVSVCEQQDVQLTFNHQRRFAEPYQKAKSLLDDGRIGALQRIEIGGHDLYDYGTHLFDMCGFMTDQAPIEWVLGQIDYRDPKRVYGLYQENQALASWRYENGIDGLVSTGEDGMVRCELRLLGDDGVIEIGHGGGPPLRLRNGSGWKTVETGRDGIWRLQTHPVDRVLERLPLGPDQLLSDPTYVERAIEDVVTSLSKGEKSTLAAEHALQTTEIIFACWESARHGGRIDLPLEIGDNPLQDLVEKNPERAPEP